VRRRRAEQDCGGFREDRRGCWVPVESAIAVLQASGLCFHITGMQKGSLHIPRKRCEQPRRPLSMETQFSQIVAS
jgi:hypothetical protein